MRDRCGCAVCGEKEGSRRRRSLVHARMLSYTSRYWAHVPVTVHNSRLRPSTSPHTFTTSFVYLPTLQPHSEAGIYGPPRPVRPETWRGKFRPIALLLEKQKTFKSTRFVVIRFNNRFKLLNTIQDNFKHSHCSLEFGLFKGMLCVNRYTCPRFET